MDFSIDTLGKILIIGGGRMGQAVLAGLSRLDGFDAGRVTVANPGLEKREAIARDYGVSTVQDAAEVLDSEGRFDTVVLAVKPQKMDDMLGALPDKVCNGALVISVAAGITTARLEGSAALQGARIVRVMPNTPLLTGCGTTVVSAGASAREGDEQLVCGLFASMGSAVVVDEQLQDAAGAISGCGPAYFALFVDALAAAGEKQGLSREVAQELALSTMLGTARMLSETGEQPQAVIEAVSSPGGTTVAALQTMEGEGLSAALARGVAAAVKRSKELA